MTRRQRELRKVEGEEQAKRLISLYRHAESDIVSRLQRMIDKYGTDAGKKPSVRLLRQQYKVIRRELKRLDAAGRREAATMVGKTYNGGFAVARRQLKDAGIVSGLSAEMSGVHKKALAVYSEQVQSRLSDLVTSAGRTVGDIYRQLQLNTTMAGAVAGTQTLRHVQDKMACLAEKGGLISFVDSAGRNWNMGSYVEMLSRTTLMQVHNAATWNEFAAHGEDLIQISYHTPTCALCAPWNGKVLSLTGKTPGYPTLAEAEGAGLFHPNCVTGDNIVSAELIEACFARRYEGKVFTVVSASGHKLTCTPNHPILTSEGWVAARALKVGDQIAEYVGKQRITFSVDPDDVQIPARIDNVFKTLHSTSMMPSVRMPITAVDFHGDGRDGNVDVVFTDRFLSSSGKPGGFQPLRKKFFRSAAWTALLFAASSFFEIFKRAFHSSHSIMRFFGKLEAFFQCHSGESGAHSFTSVCGCRYPRFFEPFTDSHFSNAKAEGNTFFALPVIVTTNDFADVKRNSSGWNGFGVGDSTQVCKFESVAPDKSMQGTLTGPQHARDLFDRLAGQIQFFNIVDVYVDSFHGVVYNLQTKDMYYVCNGIITHNCRHASSLWLPNNPEEQLTKSAEQMDVMTEAEQKSLISQLAERSGQPYNKNTKTGEDVYYDDDGRPVYPPNSGARWGSVSEETITSGILIDRYGDDRGRFLAPYGTPFEERSLPRGTDREKYRCYEVVKPIKVKKGVTLPWFGEVGGGVQYETEKPIYMLSSLRLKKDVTEDE